MVTIRNTLKRMSNWPSSYMLGKVFGEKYK